MTRVRVRGRRAGPLLLVLVFCCWNADVARAQGGFDAALRAVGEGRFAEALEAANSDADALRRAQARVYVLHQGGELHGALSAADEGLRAHPDDLWLLEQAAYIALSLRRPERSLEYSGAFADAVEGADLPPEQRASKADVARAFVTEAEGLVEAARQERVAVARAQATVGVFAVLAAALLALGARGRKTAA